MVTLLGLGLSASDDGTYCRSAWVLRTRRPRLPRALLALSAATVNIGRPRVSTLTPPMAGSLRVDGRRRMGNGPRFVAQNIRQREGRSCISGYPLPIHTEMLAIVCGVPPVCTRHF